MNNPFRILCLKIIQPMSTPIEPPRAAIIYVSRSGALAPDTQACRLSIPIYQKLAALMASSSV